MTSSSFTPALHEPLGFAQHLVDAAAREAPAHRGDDAEAAAVVAAFRDLQVRVVARRQPHALRRQQVEERLVLRRQVLVHRADHLLVGVRAGDLEHARVAREDALGLRAEAAGDDHAPVLLERLADRVERLIDRRVDEAAGVDHHEIGRLVGRGDLVAFRAQLREDALGIDQRLRAAEADEADPRRPARGARRRTPGTARARGSGGPGCGFGRLA